VALVTAIGHKELLPFCGISRLGSDRANRDRSRDRQIDESAVYHWYLSAWLRNDFYNSGISTTNYVESALIGRREILGVVDGAFAVYT